MQRSVNPLNGCIYSPGNNFVRDEPGKKELLLLVRRLFLLLLARQSKWKKKREIVGCRRPQNGCSTKIQGSIEQAAKQCLVAIASSAHRLSSDMFQNNRENKTCFAVGQ